MSESVENTGVEYYFDTFSGQLIIGRIALDAHFEAGGHSDDIHSLEKILTSPDIKIEPNQYEPLNTKDWSREEYVSYGQWLADVVDRPYTQYQLDRNTIVRAYRLGLGPGYLSIMNPDRFGSLSNFYTAIGLKNAKRREQYTEWEIEDYITYIRNAAAELGRIPTREMLFDLSRQGKGPSPFLMDEEVGFTNLIRIAGIGKERSNWTEEDFINWGVKFMIANKGRPPSALFIDRLSKKGSGPSFSAVRKRFETITQYKQLVIEAYSLEKERLDIEKEHKLKLVMEDAATGILPAELLDDSLSDEVNIQRAAQYKLIKLLRVRAPTYKMEMIASLRHPNQLITTLLRIDKRTFTKADIIETAKREGLYEDIWPDPTIEALKVA